jgi:hypothetical protein
MGLQFDLAVGRIQMRRQRASLLEAFLDFTQKVIASDEGYLQIIASISYLVCASALAKLRSRGQR